MVRTWQSRDVKTTALVDALASDLSGVLGAREVSNLRRLTGGASRETWRFDADGSAFVLQRVRPGTIGGLKQEPSVLLLVLTQRGHGQHRVHQTSLRLRN